MGHIAKLGHIWLYYSQLGLLGWKWPKLGIISYVKWPFLAIYMTWGHHDRIREGNPNMAILWVGRNFWARYFEISLYPNHHPKFLISESPQRGIIYGQNYLENNFIKSESLFDHYLEPKRHFLKFWPILASFSPASLFGSRGRARAPPYSKWPQRASSSES